jgi:hypothetical protein
MNYSNNNYNIFDGNNITINEAPCRSSSLKRCFCIRLLTNKYFLFPLILFILTLGTLIGVWTEKNNHISNLKDDLRIKENIIAEAKNQSNQTMKQSNKLLVKQQETSGQFNKTITLLKKQSETVKQLKNKLSENNATIEQLNKTLIKCKTERSRINSYLK